MKMLVITSCTGRKRDYKATAAKMYTGPQHILLMEGLKQVWATYGKPTIDLAIISAKYGLLNECDVITPYNITFQSLKKKEILARSNSLQLHERTKALIVPYDLVFFLLGEKYIQALQLPFEVPNTITQIFLLGTGYRKLIPDSPNTHFVPVGRDLALELGVMGVALKGFVFKKMCEILCRDGFQVFENVMRNPQLIPDLARGTESQQKQQSLW